MTDGELAGAHPASGRAINPEDQARAPRTWEGCSPPLDKRAEPRHVPTRKQVARERVARQWLGLSKKRLRGIRDNHAAHGTDDIDGIFAMLRLDRHMNT
jgi:hypothetical protein